MSERITQICPCPENARTAFYVGGNVALCKLTCLAIVEVGTRQEVCYMETVDNKIQMIDTEDKNFLGLIDVNDVERIKELEAEAKLRFDSRTR
jgi:hypothetical protein